MLYMSFSLLLIFLDVLFVVNAFSNGSVISKGPALIRSLYCGRMPLHRAPFHLDMSCGGYCHASMNTDTMFDIHVSDTIYWDSVLNVTVRSVAGSPYMLTGFAMSAINSEGTVVGEFQATDDVTVAECNQGTDVEGSTAFHTQAQHNRTSVTLQWTGPGQNFNDIKFRVWIVHSHDTIFYLESQPVHSLHNGTRTVNLLSMLGKLLRSKSSTDAILDAFEKSFVFRQSKGYENDAVDPFQSLRRLPRPEDLIPGSSQPPKDGPIPRHPHPSPSLPPLDSTLSPDRPLHVSSASDGTSHSRNQELSQSVKCATTPSLPGCENVKLRSSTHGRKVSSDDVSTGFKQLDAHANNSSATAVGNDSVSFPLTGANQGSADKPPGTVTGNEILSSELKDTISVVGNASSVSSQRVGSTSSTPKPLRNLSFLEKDNTSSVPAGANINATGFDSHRNLSTNSGSHGDLKGFDIDSILQNRIITPDTRSPAKVIKTTDADNNRRSGSNLLRNLGLQKVTAPKMLFMESNPASKVLQQVKPIVIRGPNPQSFRPQIPRFQQQPNAFSSQFLNRHQQFYGLPSQNLPAGDIRSLGNPQYGSASSFGIMRSGGVLSFGNLQTDGPLSFRNLLIGGVSPSGNPQSGSVTTLGISQTNGTPSLGMLQSGNVPSSRFSKSGGIPSFGNPQTRRIAPFGNSQIGGVNSLRNPQSGVPFSRIHQRLENVQSIGMPSSGKLPYGAIPLFRNPLAYSNGIAPVGNQQSGNLSLVSPHSSSMLSAENPRTVGVTQFGDLHRVNLLSLGKHLPGSAPFGSLGSSGRFSFGDQLSASTAFTNFQFNGILPHRNPLSINDTHTFVNRGLTGNQKLGLPYAPSSTGLASQSYQQGGSSDKMDSFPLSGSSFQNRNFLNPSVVPFSSSLSILSGNPHQNAIRNGASLFSRTVNLDLFSRGVPSSRGINTAINQFSTTRNQNSFNTNPFASRQSFSGNFLPVPGSFSPNMNPMMNFLRNSLLARQSAVRSDMPQFGASPYGLGPFTASSRHGPSRPGSSFSSLSREG